MAISETDLNQMAIIVIYNYYNGYYTKEYIETNFDLAVKLLVENSKNKIGGVASMSENGISITYSNGFEKFALTNDILALLPKKKNFKAW